MGCLIGVFLLLMLVVISWVITCGIIWLIALCFGLTFSWAIATGIWLILWLIRGGITIKFKEEK